MSLRLRPFPALFALLLSACAGLGQDGRGWPSLAKRPAETRGSEGVETPVNNSPAVGQEEDATLAPDLAALTDQAVQSGAAFDRLYQEVAERIRRSASSAPSSEQWVAAQVDLGRLEQARYGSVYALASLDTLYAASMKAAADAGRLASTGQIEAVRAQVLGIVDSQNDRVDSLRTLLQQP